MKQSDITVFAKILLLLAAVSSHCGLAVASEEIVKRPSSPSIRQVFLDSEQIVAYFEVANRDEYRKLIPSLFTMPERPLCRVGVVDYYRMEAGPPYLESTIDILVNFRTSPGDTETLGWYRLAEPVTTENALWGRFVYGFPKALRSVTFERHENRYVGTSYALDGKTIDFKLTLDARKTELTPDETRFLDLVSPIPALTIKDGKVLRWTPLGAGKYRIYQLEKMVPRVFTVSFGDASIEYAKDPGSYLHRLGLGRPVTGFWARMRLRWESKPME